MKVLMMPNYNRPEFLAVTLDYLAKNKEYREYQYWFILDTGYNPELLQVIKEFDKRIGYCLYFTPPTLYLSGKQSYSLLNGYLQIANLNPKLIVMVEDDVFVGKDFLAWHEAAHNQNIFCAIASKNHNTDIHPEEDYLNHGNYQSIGVSLTPNIIKTYIAPHINHEYFTHPIRYCQRHFPKSGIAPIFAEQDGLISRIQSLSGLPILFAGKPRCYHAGYYGKNIRGKRPTGTLGQKIEFIRQNCTDVYRMAQLSGGRSDCEPCPI